MSFLAGAFTPGTRGARELVRQMADREPHVLGDGELALLGRVAVGSDAMLVADADDAEQLLGFLERQGEQGMGQLDGDFALAFWSARDRRLLLARDAMGQKPLYYTELEHGVAFASDLGALLALRELSCEPDERMIVDYIGGFPEDEQRTAYARIQRLPPATLMEISRERTRVQEYWRPDSERELHLGSDAEYAEAFRAELSRAIESRLPGAGGCAVLLSGGLDSSSIACVAQGLLAARGQRLTTISAAFTDECDEGRYQREVIERTGSDHVSIAMDQAMSGTNLREALGVFRDPVPVGDHWMAWPLLEAVAERGIRVALTGVDGDRVVSHGQGRLQELVLTGDYATLWRELRPASVRRVASLLLATRLPRSAVKAIDGFLGRAERDHRAALELIRPELIGRTGARERLAEARSRPRSAREAHVRALLRSDRTSDLDLFHPLGRKLGVEVRHPFFDRRLVELCVSLPASQKLRNGVSRLVLREAMRGVLPELVRTRRSKAFFDAPFARWVNRVRRTNSRDFKNLDRFVDVARLRNEARRLPVDLFWRCMVVSAWLEGLPGTSRR